MDLLSCFALGLILFVVLVLAYGMIAIHDIPCHIAQKRGVINNKRPDDFLRGAIVIDVLDARTNKLVFRNYAVRPVTVGVDTATRQARINSAVSQALAPFFK